MADTTDTRDRSTAELLRELSDQTTALVRKEVELAKAELRADIAREVGMAKLLGAAGVGAIIGVTLLFVAGALGLAEVLPAWGAALIVAGFVLAVAAVLGAVGWGKRVRKPLATTQRTLKENVQWAKERLA